MKLVVEKNTPIAPAVRLITLRAEDGAPLPPYTPGAHLSFAIPGTHLHREYSLTGDGYTSDTYEVAVLKRGTGSVWMHALQAGEHVDAQLNNAFALESAEDGHLLIAGGIGITPILSMARRLARDGLPFSLHYASKDPASAPFGAQVTGLGTHCHLHGGSPNALRSKLAGILAAPRADARLYVCGPQAMIADVMQTAQTSGWPAGRIHVELFEGTLPVSGDRPFDVELSLSGLTVHVDAGQSLLDALIAAGVEPLYDCKRGECGMCVTPVLSGELDHRDKYLAASERAANQSICVCVSRARSASITLDL
ncbi:PDR/VanB family oxidoreductase [Paraburkholderia susongensis]|uniref:Vanillate O-demethylase ferredoxin subunit n=1 Tax=Paraburkholderia susongensis TaxID=1515439 RepID=A0A1X7JFJ5_9BURK|nr:PDR/VanB family oxidoreductase [Paraburkholderia susongensis]SMG26543.1 vanillate O-demethylase ferredoxin subunit [Paraburkholderia susongensis]